MGGPDGQGHGAPWKQGEDCWRLDCEGPHKEQVRQDCQQEEVCLCQEVSMDPGRRQGTQGIEDHWLRRRQEGHSSVCKGQGVLQPISATLPHMRVGSGKWRHQLQVWGFPQLRSAGALLSHWFRALRTICLPCLQNCLENGQRNWRK